MRTSATELHDGGRELMMKQRGFQLINPTEKWFPGLIEIRNNFASWDWRYGKTPKFTAKKDLQLKSDEKDFAVQLKINVDAVSFAKRSVFERECVANILNYVFPRCSFIRGKSMRSSWHYQMQKLYRS